MAAFRTHKAPHTEAGFQKSLDPTFKLTILQPRPPSRELSGRQQTDFRRWAIFLASDFHLKMRRAEDRARTATKLRDAAVGMAGETDVGALAR